MQTDDAVIKEPCVTFAIVIVKEHVIQNNLEADKIRSRLAPFFPDIPIILMAQDSRGIPIYQGREDLVHYLAHVDAKCTPCNSHILS